MDRALAVTPERRQLAFPPAFRQNIKDQYEPSTAIKQFSTGRSAVLGLSDDGKVWSWTSDTASLVKPVHVDIREHKVEKVVAGWERGSMYVQDVGIVYWALEGESDVVNGGRRQNLAVADALLVETATVPGTAFRNRADTRFSSDSLDARVGEVVNYIILETHIVFTTRLNKVFSYPNTYPMSDLAFIQPLELTIFSDTDAPVPPQILDIQGSFRNFAVFTNDGAIWTADRDFLDAFHKNQTSTETSHLPLPTPILFKQSPEKARIISIAFGDHHRHALHEDGTLTSWGSQPQSCGALGLGDGGQEVLRGVQASRWGRDQHLPLEHAKTIWFEPLMAKWLRDVYACTEQTLQTLLPPQVNGRPTKEVMGDYYEKQGAKWEREGDVGAYFVLKVAAAGWSSAALVLVDEEKAERARQGHIIKSYTASSTTGSSAAEYEYGDSPFDMVEIALRNISGWIWRSGRYFLGLMERDAGSGEEEEVYTWSGSPVPIDDIITGNWD